MDRRAELVADFGSSKIELQSAEIAVVEAVLEVVVVVVVVVKVVVEVVLEFAAEEEVVVG